MGLFDEVSDMTSAFQDVIGDVTDGLSNPIGSLSEFGSSLGIDFGSISSAGDILGGLTGRFSQGASSFVPGGLGHHVLAGAQGRKDPLLTYCWYCNMPNIKGLSLPWNYVEEFTAPFRSIDVTSRYQQGKMQHYASANSIQNLSLRAYEDGSGKAGSYFEAWRDLVIGMNGVYNYPASYKKTIELVVLDVSRTVNVYTFRYKGCFPTTTDPYTLQSSDSSRLVYGQEFSVDDVEINVQNTSMAGLANSIWNSVKNFPEGLFDELAGIADVSDEIRGVYQTGKVLSGLFG